MSYQHELQFLMQFLKNHKINACFYTSDREIASVDFHLRQLLGVEHEYKTLENFLNHRIQPNTIYKIIDHFQCVYYIMQLPGENSSPFVIGPYAHVRIDHDLLQQDTETYSISPQMFQELQVLFYQIPILVNDMSLQTLIQTFGEAVWGAADNFQFHILDHHLEESLYSPMPQVYPNEDFTHIETQLWDAYLPQENELLQAVSQGQTAKAEEILSVICILLQAHETGDMLRNMKNYALSLNTLFRKVIEINAINSYQIVSAFSRFSHKIEHCASPEACTALLREIVRKYCLLVKNHSMVQYSVLVQQTIKYINMDLTADLTLHTMAKRLNVNASYLSTHFKKITGTAYTEFVNRRRIDHSLFLLNTTSLQIQTIAQYCGISDLNYFTKLFKKYIHMSPTSYRKKMLEK